MPKELLEIKSFNLGTMLSPDMTDIPTEAASYSLNLDSVTEDGKLKCVPGDGSINLETIAGPYTPATPITMSDGAGVSQLKIDQHIYMIVKTTSGWAVGNIVSGR